MIFRPVSEFAFCSIAGSALLPFSERTALLPGFCDGEGAFLHIICASFCATEQAFSVLF